MEVVAVAAIGALVVVVAHGIRLGELGTNQFNGDTR